MKIVIGVLFALLPAIVAGVVLGMMFESVESGLVIVIGVFGCGLDVVFNGKRE